MAPKKEESKPSKLDELRTQLETEIEQHNNLASNIENSKKQVEAAEHQLFKIQGRIELIQEQIQAEESPDEATD